MHFTESGKHFKNIWLSILLFVVLVWTPFYAGAQYIPSKRYSYYQGVEYRIINIKIANAAFYLMKDNPQVEKEMAAWEAIFKLTEVRFEQTYPDVIGLDTLLLKGKKYQAIDKSFYGSRLFLLGLASPVFPKKASQRVMQWGSQLLPYSKLKEQARFAALISALFSADNLNEAVEELESFLGEEKNPNDLTNKVLANIKAGNTSQDEEIRRLSSLVNSIIGKNIDPNVTTSGRLENLRIDKLFEKYGLNFEKFRSDCLTLFKKDLVLLNGSKTNKGFFETYRVRKSNSVQVLTLPDFTLPLPPKSKSELVSIDGHRVKLNIPNPNNSVVIWGDGEYSINSQENNHLFLRPSVYRIDVFTENKNREVYFVNLIRANKHSTPKNHTGKAFTLTQNPEGENITLTTNAHKKGWVIKGSNKRRWNSTENRIPKAIVPEIIALEDSLGNTYGHINTKIKQ